MSEKLEPVAQQWAAFEFGSQKTSWYPAGYGDEAGWAEVAKRYDTFSIIYRELVTLSSATSALEAKEARIKELETSVLDAAFSDALDNNGAPVTWRERATAAQAEAARLRGLLEVVKVWKVSLNDGGFFVFSSKDEFMKFERHSRDIIKDVHEYTCTTAYRAASSLYDRIKEGGE